ncbi:Histidyl-tRNA synthetase [Elusimicrobium minutum Pei191]|uniref:Histidine--tRNA ligase n=1 Tax=Elusimicrobium minutum (strain Pei191) TaxID=445932 RepID=SYH_ELUMP|nr:histidine--tRNA ligase [Elusimicrobium minutum]B2KBC0.1 RecName: Full=Histidine--tRNA ligase; AltName: Full=Histidyl-tRNA synthetase; Short=HisRS [Elusimicrobium minutum Pei191]ACC97942.1 Histidyl-tRNA synthetase [Elusimicrobium minutum Pei191]
MTKLVRGFRDIFAPESNNFAELEACARRVFTLAGGTEVRIPTLELKELFIKSTGDTTDIVQKEMYAFEDAGGRVLAMRPEGTPGTVRAYIENNFAQTAPVQKLFYIGNMFRAERPQAGRYREFEQIGMEYIGNPSPAADAEIILMIKDIVTSFGVKNYGVKINSLGCQECRPAYKQELINYLKKDFDTLCEKCKDRLEKNPLRVLDCKIDGARFKENAPKQKLCAACENHFNEVKTFLQGRIDYIIDPSLVRGLDYYTRTVFEFQAGDSAQNAIAGGGRYDSLVKSMGGADMPAVGFAMGVERTIAARGETKDNKQNKIFVVSLDKNCNAKAFEIMSLLRSAGVICDGGLFDKNLKAQMKQADRTKSSFALLLGADEFEKGVVTMRDLSSGEQQEIKFNDILNKVGKIRL